MISGCFEGIFTMWTGVIGWVLDHYNTTPPTFIKKYRGSLTLCLREYKKEFYFLTVRAFGADWGSGNGLSSGPGVVVSVVKLL